MKRRRKKTRRFLSKKVFTVLLVSLVVAVVAFVGIMFAGTFFNAPFESYEDAEVVEIDKSTGKVNALLVGVDKGGNLTDTIMIASYDMDKNQVNILSVPRDTRMYVGSRYQKINSAHAISKNGKNKGINGTIDAVTRLTGIPINYYVEFTFSAFRETIDALGGVEFDVPQNMNYDDPVQNLHIHLKKGLQVLDGEKAEQFVRFRRYPMGDIDRVKAQQAFVKAFCEQKLNASIIEKVPELFKALQKNLTTNITAKDVLRYIGNLKELTSENVHMHSIPGSSNGTDYGSSYWIPDMTALRSLIETTFGYDASKITIHSADGKSASKDVKIVSSTVPSSTPAPSNTPEPSATPKPSETPAAMGQGGRPAVNPTAEPTKKPTQKPTDKADDEEKAEATQTPMEEPTPKPTPKPTEKPEQSAGGRPAANPAEE